MLQTALEKNVCMLPNKITLWKDAKNALKVALEEKGLKTGDSSFG